MIFNKIVDLAHADFGSNFNHSCPKDWQGIGDGFINGGAACFCVRAGLTEISLHKIMLLLFEKDMKKSLKSKCLTFIKIQAILLENCTYEYELYAFITHIISLLFKFFRLNIFI